LEASIPAERLTLGREAGRLLSVRCQVRDFDALIEEAGVFDFGRAKE
jgi:hypothetical protein